MFPWLAFNDFKKWVGEFSENFEAEKELTPYVTGIVDSWPKRLIGSTKIAELKAILLLVRAREANNQLPVVEISVRQQQYLDSLIPFLCFSSYADYVTLGHIKVTRSGPVKKASANEVTLLDKDERKALELYFLGKAKQEALELSQLFEEDKQTNACAPSTGAKNGRPTSTIIRAVDNSIFPV